MSCADGHIGELSLGVDPVALGKTWAPRLPDRRVVRERLISKLEAGLDRPLTLIVAPAGFGKTTLALEWAQRHPFAFVSVDELDATPERLVVGMVSALRGRHPGWAERAPSPEAALLELPNLPERTILVLDDLHLADSPGSWALVRRLAESAGAWLHLVATCRHEPCLPLARLRVRRQVTEIRALELAFTRGEVASVLQEGLGLHLDPASVERLTEATEGWAAGVQLAGLSLQKGDDFERFIETFNGTHRHVLDYLLDEVLATQPPHIQSFLQQTAILDRFNASLCEATTDASEAQALIDEIDRRGLFLVPLDETRTWYRYHSMFAECLRARNAENRTQHRRAAVWWCGESDPERALSHAVQSADFDLVESVLDWAAPALAGRGQIPVLHQLLAPLPDEATRGRHRIALMRAQACFFRGVPARAEIPPADEETLEPKLRAEALTLYAVRARDEGNLEEAMAQAQQALACPNEWLGHRTIAEIVVSAVLLARGEFQAAQAAVDRASVHAGKGPGASHRSVVEAYRARTRSAAGDLAGARAIAEAELARLQTLGQSQTTFAAHVHGALADLSRREGSTSEAERHLNLATELAEQGGNRAFATQMAIELVEVRLSRRDREGAEDAWRRCQRYLKGLEVPRLRERAARVREAIAAVPKEPEVGLLSDREREVLRLAAAGRRNPEIADQLFLSPGTVKRHLYNISQKLGGATRIDWIRRAQELGELP